MGRSPEVGGSCALLNSKASHGRISQEKHPSMEDPRFTFYPFFGFVIEFGRFTAQQFKTARILCHLIIPDIHQRITMQLFNIRDIAIDPSNQVFDFFDL